MACSVATLPVVLQSLDHCPSVTLVVVYPHSGRPMPASLPAPPEGARAKVVTLDDVRAAGRATPQPPCPPQPDTVATLCYTSGTTGNPKVRPSPPSERLRSRGESAATTNW